MALHLVLSPGIDLDEFRRQSEQGLCPRHSIAVLAERLDAIVHIPHPERDWPNAFDRLRSRLIGSAETWALARRLASQLSRNDVVYCQSESVGLPVAALLERGPTGPSSSFSLTILTAPAGTSPPVYSVSPVGPKPWGSVAPRKPNSSITNWGSPSRAFTSC